MKLQFILHILIPLSLINNSIFAQELQGTVKDIQTKELLPGATLYIPDIEQADRLKEGTPEAGPVEDGFHNRRACPQVNKDEGKIRNDGGKRGAQDIAAFDVAVA